MPSFYAHERFGREVLAKLPGETRIVIENHRQLFDIGLQGPDILFYYKPLGPHPINRLAREIHMASGREFFSQAAQALAQHGKKDREALLAYIYGSCCHFALDAGCHAFVEEKASAGNVGHVEIETEFDRSLMLEDGLDPLSHSLTESIVPSRENAEVICKFYGHITAAEVLNALKSMKFYNRLILSPSKLKRGVLFAAMKVAGCYDRLRGYFVNYHSNPHCADSTKTLWILYDEAIGTAVTLIKEFNESAVGRLPFNEMYEYNFNGVRIKTEE